MKDMRRGLSRNAFLYQQSSEGLQQSLVLWNRRSLFQKRVLLRQMGMPSRLYKYRAIPPADDTMGRARLEDFLVNNRLWLGTVSAFNDPFEGRADYVVPYRGAELRHALERKYRELGFGSQDAKLKVDSGDVANPKRMEERARQGNMRLLETVGVCALGTNATSPLLWSHYAQEHSGICVQLRPVMDLEALIAHPVEYNDTYPILSDMLEPPEARKTLPIMRKSTAWEYEKEWRIVALDAPNTHRAFAPDAMGAVILGMRISDADKAYVLALMDERQRRYSVRPTVYVATAAKLRYRVEIRRLR